MVSNAFAAKSTVLPGSRIPASAGDTTALTSKIPPQRTCQKPRLDWGFVMTQECEAENFA